jgi:adenosylcobyric acid synthase
MLKAGQAIPGDAKLVLIPGSKSTRGDLNFLREQGWDIDLYAHYRRGGHILGLCGGYQMLGKQIDDPDGLDGPAGRTEGLGLLDVKTEMLPEKTLRKITAIHRDSSLVVEGYEIHLGRTTGEDCKQPFAYLDKEPEGACSKDGRISGSYLHGLFCSDGFRSAFLENLGVSGGDLKYEKNLDDVLNELAKQIEDQLDVDALLEVAK